VCYHFIVIIQFLANNSFPYSVFLQLTCLAFSTLCNFVPNCFLTFSVSVDLLFLFKVPLQSSGVFVGATGICWKFFEYVYNKLLKKHAIWCYLEVLTANNRSNVRVTTWSTADYTSVTRIMHWLSDKRRSVSSSEENGVDEVLTTCTVQTSEWDSNVGSSDFFGTQ